MVATAKPRRWCCRNKELNLAKNIDRDACGNAGVLFCMGGACTGGRRTAAVMSRFASFRDVADAVGKRESGAMASVRTPIQGNPSIYEEKTTKMDLTKNGSLIS